MKILTTFCVLVACCFHLLSAREVIVDNQHPACSDAQSGSHDNPFKTIQAAVDKAEPGDIIVVKPGLYREAVCLKRSGTPEMPIVLKSEIPHQAIISGADEITNWQHADGNIWHAPLPTKSRYNEHGNGEWLFMDGFPMIQCQDESKLLPGMFFFDWEKHVVVMELYAGMTPTSAAFELSVRDGLIRPVGWITSQKYDHTQTINDIEIEGFKLIHNGDWFRGFGAIRVSGSRWKVRNNHIAFAIRDGMDATYSADCLILDNLIEWAGATGVGGATNARLHFENNTVRYCNWTLHNPNHEGGGSKFVFTIDSHFKGNTFVSNYGSGFWMDIQNAGNLIEDSVARDNFGHAGFFSEIGWNDVYLNNLSFNNEVGFMPGECVGTMFRHNVAFNNSRLGIRVRGNWHRQNDHDKGLDADIVHGLDKLPGIDRVRLENYKARHLTFGVVPNGWPPLATLLIENLIFNNGANYFEHTRYDGGKTVPHPYNFADYNLFYHDDPAKQATYTGGHYDSFEDWQQKSSSDLHSKWQNPLTATELPDWAKTYQGVWTQSFLDLDAIGLAVVRSPETAALCERLRRADQVHLIETRQSDVHLAKITEGNSYWYAAWASCKYGLRRLDLQTRSDLTAMDSRNSYLVKKELSIHDGLISLSLHYKPIYLYPPTDSLQVVHPMEVQLKSFGRPGEVISGKVLLRNLASTEAKPGLTIDASHYTVQIEQQLSETVAGQDQIEVAFRLVPVRDDYSGVERIAFQGKMGDRETSQLRTLVVGVGGASIPCLSQAIVVDGQTDDWQNIEPMKLLYRMDIDGLRDVSKWQGKEDLSGAIYLGWKDGHLFVRIDVMDDHVIGCPSDKQPYLSDGIEFFIDGRAADMQWQADRTPGTLQYIISPETPEEATRLMIFGGHSSGHNWQTRRTENGYVVEGMIPLSASNFPAGSFTPDRPIKCAVNLLDRDEGVNVGPSKVLAWGATIIEEANGRKESRSHADTTGWNLLTLDK